MGKFFCFISGRRKFLKGADIKFYFENFILQGNKLEIFYNAHQTDGIKIFMKITSCQKKKGKIRKENKNWIAEDTK